MNYHGHRLRVPLILAIGWLTVFVSMNAAETQGTNETNKLLVQAAFERWRAGTVGPFEMLARDATWTITGNSLVAKKYATRDERRWFTLALDMRSK